MVTFQWDQLLLLGQDWDGEIDINRQLFCGLFVGDFPNIL